QAAVEAVLAAQPVPTEPALARTLVRSLGPAATLVVASSMPVRDLEWFGPATPAPPRVLANRGANGIDGTLSTALGVAASGRRGRGGEGGSAAGSGSGGRPPPAAPGSQVPGDGAGAGTGGEGRGPAWPPGLGPGGPVVALVGDLAFLHDAGALLGCREGPDLTVVVVDNGGGGIFSFLPQARELDGGRFERLFGTPQPVDLAGVARAYGAELSELERVGDLGTALVRAPGSSPVRVVRARTDRRANVAVHLELEEAVAAAVGRLGA
ncbi:MAG: thiamine pyrophosphate-dependent enzyme, partial [Acidimicrobiales bacterium]